MVDVAQPLTVLQTRLFARWLADLDDERARARIAARIRRAQQGNLGDARTVGGGVSEMRVDYGPGYRVYFVRRRMVPVVLLCGGIKSTQDADIRKARSLAAEVMT